MHRVVGAVVVIGMICLAGLLGEGMVRVHPARPDSSAVLLPDSLPIPTVASTRTRVTRAPASFEVNALAFLSRAPADSLDLLPGIGPALAARIVDARAARGGFSSWNDVLAVKGIGPRMVARLKSLSSRQ